MRKFAVEITLSDEDIQAIAASYGEKSLPDSILRHDVQSVYEDHVKLVKSR